MTVTLFDLLRWELRQVRRTPLVWLAVGLFGLACGWSVYSAAQLQHKQITAQRQLATEQTAWRAMVRARAERMKLPGDELPFWQDPTGVAGFSRYFLKQSAVKPVLPMAVLAVGGADLQPAHLPVKLDTLYGVEPAYDFENPRSLSLGAFDPAFVVTTLLPLLLIAVVAVLGTVERDRGVLRLIAAQAVTPRQWLATRVLAIALWMVPALLLTFMGILATTGAITPASIPELSGALAVIGAYLLFWLALAYLALSAWPSAAGAAASLTGIWLVLGVGLPLLLDAAAAWRAPAPSRIAYVGALRETTALLTAERAAFLGRIFTARADLAGATDRITALDTPTRNTFITPEMELRLEPWQSEFTRVRTQRERYSALGDFLAPPLGVQAALTRLAGTDSARHRRFETAVRDYQLGLRSLFYPLIQRELAMPTPRSPGSAGRLNFSNFEGTPAFTWQDEPATARLRGVLPLAGWLCVLSAVFTGIATLRLRRWPADL